MSNVNMSPTISIITPTYNRGELLGRVFDSLKKQTSNDFEWIVVDDGSVDNTENIVKDWSADFPIIYVKKENGGKHTALNAAHPYVNGKYTLVLDSDDYLTDDAVATIINNWNKFEDDENIAIVTFLKGSSVDKPFCKAADEGIPVEIIGYERICFESGDCMEVIRTDLFKKFPYPVFDGERFISESILWNQVGMKHKCVYINKVLYIANYLEGGLTSAGRHMRVYCPLGGMVNSNILMSKKCKLYLRIKEGLLYTCYGFFAKKSPCEMAMTCDYKLLMWVCMPAGWLMYRLWKKKYY